MDNRYPGEECSNHDRMVSKTRLQGRELQLPAHNEVDEEAVRQFISTIPLPLSLEILGVGVRRVMLVRGPEDRLRFMAGKIQTLWSSAVLRILDDDPVNPSIVSCNGSLCYELHSDSVKRVICRLTRGRHSCGAILCIRC